MNKDSQYLVYKDIQERTNGEFYIAVVGPVRTGKSTFIKRFMDVLVLPNMEDVYGIERAKDEMPQSATGKTIMTTEPKFIPQMAAEISLSSEVNVKARLVDCVGYIVDGAEGHIEGGVERMVRTPWSDGEISFSQAATIGTKKVIHDHATIAVVVTTDGSIGDIPRANYKEAEERTISELKAIGKPFVVIVNSMRPLSEDAKKIASSIEEEQGVCAMAMNIAQLREEDISKIMENVLYEFPITQVEFTIPKWVEMLKMEHPIKQELISYVREIMDGMDYVRDAVNMEFMVEGENIDLITVSDIGMDTGCIKVAISMQEECYYKVLSELTGAKMESEYDLIHELQQLASLKFEYEEVKDAMNSVRMKGYGVVTPNKKDITLHEPEIIKQGNKYGVKIQSSAPSLHFIKANIETEIAPIVGSEAQAEDLVRYIKESAESEEGIWNTNIFGKSIETLVEDGIRNKITTITDESQVKLQDTMQKIVNDSNGGMVCIII